MNPGRFEERLMHELKNHVEQRAQNAADAEEAARRPGRTGRRRWVPVGLTAGLAASVAAAVLVLNPGGGAGSAVAGGGDSLNRISTVAYTLQREPSGEVKVIMGKPEGDIAVEGLQRDLARMGVRAKVIVTDPNCPPAATDDETVSTSAPKPRQTVRADPKLAKAYRPAVEHGKHVVYINPKVMPTDETLIFVFDEPKKAFGYSVSLWPGNGPECIHGS
ncbi:hypothetical protein ACFYW6_39205 [Streptomyces sp. NPDC002659]|uniref:hypothetical protein n=1 Tax=Streptomyces sp. NPDC002659 TaxID=3364656 RepID=UPI0036A466BC